MKRPDQRNIYFDKFAAERGANPWRVEFDRKDCRMFCGYFPTYEDAYAAANLMRPKEYRASVITGIQWLLSLAATTEIPEAIKPSIEIVKRLYWREETNKDETNEQQKQGKLADAPPTGRTTRSRNKRSNKQRGEA